ncbi:MAG: 50S ribosomal protein L29 [bacterium]|nr:50S ribosomal protein L29 [bacterium]
MKKIKDIRELSEVELEKAHLDAIEELVKLRFQKSTGQVENPRLLRNTRRILARIKTVLRERELQQNKHRE